MPVLTNTTGAVVSVSDETALRLGAEWKPVEEAQPKPKSKK